jgi:hypothetical protein
MPESSGRAKKTNSVAPSGFVSRTSLRAGVASCVTGCCVLSHKLEASRDLGKRETRKEKKSDDPGQDGSRSSSHRKRPAQSERYKLPHFDTRRMARRCNCRFRSLQDNMRWRLRDSMVPPSWVSIMNGLAAIPGPHVQQPPPPPPPSGTQLRSKRNTRAPDRMQHKMKG